jgi:peptide-methionine (S)-S-oxide reductase
MIRSKSYLLLTLLLLGGVFLAVRTALANDASSDATTTPTAASLADGPPYAKATFAGGCFWCMEPPYDELDGVISTTSGYTGGRVENPTYEQVSSGGTGHAEAVEVIYDPEKVSYEKLLDVFWHNVDPLTANAQFCDHGSQYRTGIFYRTEEQKRLAEASKRRVAARFDEPVVTEIVKAPAFYPAEEYHQNYYQKNPLRYKFYRFNCGRDARLEDVWGDEAPHA